MAKDYGSTGKMDKEDCKDFIDDAERYLRYADMQTKHLPRTPGREAVERGIEQAREGLKEVKKEAEID